MFSALMSTKSTIKALLAGLALAATASHAAGVSTFFAPSSFVSGTTYVFDQFDPGFGLENSYLGNPVSVTGSGVSLQANESKVFGLSSVGYLSDIVYSAKTADTDASPNAITAIISGDVKAIGFYLGSYNYPGTPYSAVVTSDSIDYSFSGLSVPVSTNTFGFVGFSSTSAITKIVFTQPSPNNALDVQKFTIGSVTPVPEPSIYAMFGAGLALFGMIGRRRSRKQ